MNVEARSSWTRTEIAVPYRIVKPYPWVAVHWPGITGSLNLRTHSDCQKLMHTLDSNAINSGEYGAIPYQVGVCAHSAMEGRTRERVNGANGDAAVNLAGGSIVVLVGTKDDVTDAHKAHIFEALAYLKSHVLKTHNQVRPEPTACPGPQLTEWILNGYPNPEDEVSAKDVWDYQISTADGDVKAQQLLRRTDRRVKALLELVKAQNGTDQAAVAAALREVLGSLDDA